MDFSFIASYVVVAFAAAALIYAALSDLKNFTIRNSLVLLLAFLYVVHAALTRRWAEVPRDLELAAVMFAITLVFYWLGLLGGGDVKLLTVAFLWVGGHGAMVFAILLGVISFIHVIAGVFGWLSVRQVGRRRQIAFAPSVAGALIGSFMLGSVQPWPWDVPRQLAGGNKPPRLHVQDLRGLQ